MRYVIKARGINVFKNGRSFSDINYAKRKLLEISEILDEDFVIDEIPSEIEKLQAEIAEKEKEIVEARELILMLYNTLEDVHDYDSVKDWLEKYGEK